MTIFGKRPRAQAGSRTAESDDVCKQEHQLTPVRVVPCSPMQTLDENGDCYIRGMKTFFRFTVKIAHR